MDDFDAFICCEVYEKAIELIKNKTNIGIDNDYTHVIKDRELDLLTKANITIDEMTNILKDDFDKIIMFVIIKIDYYKGEKDNGGDFPKGEGIGKDERSITIKELG